MVVVFCSVVIRFGKSFLIFRVFVFRLESGDDNGVGLREDRMRERRWWAREDVWWGVVRGVCKL